MWSLRFNLLALVCCFCLYSFAQEGPETYVQEREKLIEKCATDSCKVKYLYEIGTRYLSVKKYDLVLTYMDSVLNVAEYNKLFDMMAKSYIVKGIVYSRERDFESTGHVYSLAEKLIDKINSDYLRSNLYSNIASNFYRQGVNDSAKIYYHKNLNSLSIENKNYYKDKSETLSDLGLIETNNGNFRLALTHFKEALSYQDSLNVSDHEKASILNKIGIVYKRTRDYENALLYFQKAESIADKNSTTGKSSQFNIANTYASMNQRDSAFRILQFLYSDIDNLVKTTKCNVVSLLSKYYLELDSLEQAKKMNEELYGYIETYDIESKKGEYYHNSGIIAIKGKKFSQAFAFLNQAKEFYELHGVKNTKKHAQILDELIRLSFQLGKIDSAEGYYDNYVVYSDSSSKIVLEHEVQKWREEFETEQKERKIVEQALELEQAKLTNYRLNTRNTIIGIISFVLLSVIGLFLFRSWRRRRRLSKALNSSTKKNEELRKKYRHDDFKERLKVLSNQRIRLHIGRNNEVNIVFGEILYISSADNYLNVHTINEDKFTIRSTLKHFLSGLPEELFVQCNRSYAINLNMVKEWSSDYILLDGDVSIGEISITPKFKEKCLEKLQKVYPDTPKSE